MVETQNISIKKAAVFLNINYFNLMKTQFQQNPTMESAMLWVDWVIHDMGPGPYICPMRYYINFHKGGMAFFLFAMMLYFDNFGLGAWLYLALHGSYGFFWILKDLTFPDTSFQKPVKVCSFIFPQLVFQPYYYGAYLMMSGQAIQNPTPERVCLCVVTYTIGIVLMMGADG